MKKKMIEIVAIITLCCINFATILLSVLIGQHGFAETLNKLTFRH